MRKVHPCFYLEYQFCCKRICLQSAWRKKVKIKYFLEKWNTTFNRGGSRKETILQMEVHGIWWNSSINANGDGQYQCKATLLSWEGWGSSPRAGRKQGGIDELQPVDFDHWENVGAYNPALTGLEATGSCQHGFLKGKSCLTNLITFYDEMSSLVDKGRAVYVDFLTLERFLKSFSIASSLIKMRR